MNYESSDSDTKDPYDFNEPSTSSEKNENDESNNEITGYTPALTMK